MSNEMEILNAALRVFGAEAQTFMMLEEMSELQKELCKEHRGYNTRVQIADEIADVLIMLEQMVMLYDCEKETEEWINFKLQRLANTIRREREAREKEGQHEPKKAQ